MIDFALTDKGDLIFEKQSTFLPFRLDFRLSQFPGFRLQFFQAPYQDVVKNEHFQITFHTKAHSAEPKYKALLVEGIDAKIQQIKIRLRTELTELPVRQAIGSQLQLVKHKRLNSPINISRIQEITVSALADIVPKIEVIAKAELGVGHFYCQNVNIYIYSNGTLFYKFSL